MLLLVDKEREPSATVLPTAPVIVIVPPVPPIKTMSCPPLTVLENKISEPAGTVFVVSTVTGPVKETGPVIVTGLPFVVILLFKLIKAAV